MKKTILFLILAIVLINLAGVSAQESCKSITIIEFYGQGCPNCAQLEEFLKTINNSCLNIEKYEVYFNKENAKLFEQMARAYNTKIQGVPTLFIDDKVISGFNNEIGNQIKQEIEKCKKEVCINPKNKIKNSKKISTLTIPAIISAAIVDSINPCEFAVLIILLSTILITGNRKKALLAGLAFSLAIYLSYFLMGIGLYSAITSTHITKTIYIIASILAILLGLLNIKDYFFYGKGILMEVPRAWRPKMKMLIKSVTSIPGAFFLGIIISLFLLPCTSGPYIVILGMLAETATKNTAVLLLMFYNLIFILPMLIITFAIYYGWTTTERVENFRMRKLRTLHLIAGVILVLLGIAMLLSFVLRWI